MIKADLLETFNVIIDKYFIILVFRGTCGWILYNKKSNEYVLCWLLNNDENKKASDWLKWLILNFHPFNIDN
jgi:uncharacterized membrane protein